MIEPELMERIKSALQEYEPHFGRLHTIAEAYAALDEAQEGFYREGEPQLLERWERVTQKIARGLDETIKGCTITCADAQRPDLYRMCLHVSQEDEGKPATLQIDYGSEGQLVLQVL